LTDVIPPFYGNAHVIARLYQQIERGRLPHTMIFTGPDGVGKRTCAIRVAQMLNCRAAEDAPCGVCSDCRKIENGLHSDVQMLTLEEGASQIKIEQVRSLRSSLEFEPLEGLAKVYVIEPAERLTLAAANALLKVLEEPPPATYFVLVTANSQELLATIRSRGQTYHFSPVSLEEIRNAGVEDELVLRWSHGSVGRALVADPDELRSSRDTVLGFLETVLSATDEALVELLDASSALSRSKDDYRDRIRVLEVLVSDLIFLKEDMKDRVVNFDIEERLNRLEKRVSLDRIVQIGDCLKFIEANLKHYLNRQLMTDQLALLSNRITSQLPNDKPQDSG
jgi:DNA polymerase-3 subunit delta'